MISRKEGRLVVRHDSKEATPYLRSLGKRLSDVASFARHKNGHQPRAIDVGCGNGRNSEFLMSLGFDVVPFDLRPDYGLAIDLEQRKLPVFDQSVNVVLLQYVLMFLTIGTRKWVIDRAMRALAFPGMLVVEVMPVKTGLMSAGECEDTIGAIAAFHPGRFRAIRKSKHKVALCDMA